MLRILRVPAVRWIRLGVFLLLAGCAPPSAAPRPPSTTVEQTTEILTPDRLEAPLREHQAHLAELGITRWHRHDCRGQGMKIAILDSGFRGFRHFLGKGLPARVTVRSFRKDHNLEARDSQHGVLCGEILHAIAPAAELLLANWEPDSPQAFVEAVRWAKSEGAKIVSCSLIMPSWSDGEGGGEVHRDLQAVLGAGRLPRDLLFFASAGNTAERHWCGAFAPNDAGWHRWQGEVTENVIKPWGQERVAVELYGPSSVALEMLIYREKGDLVGTSVLEADAARTCSRAVVRFEPAPNERYQVRLRCPEASSAANREAFHLVVLGGALDHATSRGSIPFPGDGAAVTTVGAVDGERRRLAYSACGPNSRQPKPDFVATVPFPSLCRQRPFAGTSAAAPQAAAVAALLWSRQPNWTARQVLQAMREAALDLGPPGHDCETGHGLIRLALP